MVQPGGFVASLILVLLGLVIAVKPEWYIRLAKWQIKNIWAGEFKTTSKTASRMRVLGLLLFLLGAIILYTVYMFS